MTTTETTSPARAKQVTDIADGYKTRLAVVLERYDAYHPDCQRRYAGDEYHDTARALRNCAKWLAGDHDISYAGPHPIFGVTLEDFRVHYAGDALRTAFHHLVWAEHYAGLTDREAAMATDPLARLGAGGHGGRPGSLPARVGALAVARNLTASRPNCNVVYITL